jgi:hypothetical protein
MFGKKSFYGFGLFLAFYIISCTVLKVTEREENGYFPASNVAYMVENKNVNLDTIKSLLVVQNGEFMYGMAQRLDYFDTIVTFEQFERDIITNNKQDLVGDINGKIGLNKAYRHYKKFLYLTMYQTNSKGVATNIRLKLTNPNTLEEIFISQLPSTGSGGVNDQNVFYPLFNKMVDYIYEHSDIYKEKNKTYKKRTTY